MSVDIDFAGLSIKDALDLAILVEDEAEERYRELADNLELHNTADAARFFRFMAGCEAKHGQELAERRAAMFGDKPPRCSIDKSSDCHRCRPEDDAPRRQRCTTELGSASMWSRVTGGERSTPEEMPVVQFSPEPTPSRAAKAQFEGELRTN